MAKTVEEIQKWLAEIVKRGFGSQCYWESQYSVSLWIRTLLAEIERLEKQSAEFVAANAGLAHLIAETSIRLSAAAAVCEEAAILRRRIHAVEHRRGYDTTRDARVFAALWLTLDAYLAGKQEKGDGPARP